MISKGIHWWDKEEIETLAELRKQKKTYKEIAKIMSEKFNHNFTWCAISSAASRYVYNNIEAPEKGYRGYQFLEPGTERTVGEYELVKTETGKWRSKQRVKYKEYYGEIPKGYVVIFANCNKKDFRKENLIAVSRNVLKIMNKYNLLKADTEETKVGVTIAKLIEKTQELKKNL